MTTLTKIEMQWIVSALRYTADNCKAQADELTGVLQGIALQAEGNNRATADKLEAVLDSDAKHIAIK